MTGNNGLTNRRQIQTHIANRQVKDEQRLLFYSLNLRLTLNLTTNYLSEDSPKVS